MHGRKITKGEKCVQEIQKIFQKSKGKIAKNISRSSRVRHPKILEIKIKHEKKYMSEKIMETEKGIHEILKRFDKTKQKKLKKISR